MIKALTAAVISLAIVFQIDTPGEPAQAATCSVSGGQSTKLKYSGQVSQVSATVCGNQIWKLIGKPKKSTKPVKPTKPRKYSNNFTVVPDKPKIVGSVASTVGQSTDFTALAIRHTRNRLLFWYPSQVRFLPKTYEWSFGDGQTAQGASANHTWGNTGVYQVKVVVGYSVKYRIIGHSTWVALSGLVYATSAPIAVTIDQNQTQNAGKVALVHWTCDQKPIAAGC